MEILIEAKNISKCYEGKVFWGNKKDGVLAVNNLSIKLLKGRSVGLVGESGCGKSTFGRMLAGLETPTKGKVIYRGQQISGFSLHKMRPYRKNIQMIFQNSSSVFDPSYTIGESIAEVVKNNVKMNSQDCFDRVHQILNQVGLNASYAGRFSRELSGGERQRANIARALVLHPEFVVCDEPVSSLDYSLRKQILTLLNDLRRKFGITYLFITHDLHCIPYVCDSIVILYAGRILEQIDLKCQSMESALHPYTNLLLASVPAKDPTKRKKTSLEKTADNLCTDDFSYCCHFYPRCPYCTERCAKEIPLLKKINNSHLVACHNVFEMANDYTGPLFSNWSRALSTVSNSI